MSQVRILRNPGHTPRTEDVHMTDEELEDTVSLSEAFKGVAEAAEAAAAALERLTATVAAIPPLELDD